MAEPKYTDKFGDGFENYNYYGVRDSWIPVIDEALDRIFEIAPNTVLHQIKEKFGELRIYTNNDAQNEVYEIIRETERKVHHL